MKVFGFSNYTQDFKYCSENLAIALELLWHYYHNLTEHYDNYNEENEIVWDKQKQELQKDLDDQTLEVAALIGLDYMRQHKQHIPTNLGDNYCFALLSSDSTQLHTITLEYDYNLHVHVINCKTLNLINYDSN